MFLSPITLSSKVQNNFKETSERHTKLATSNVPTIEMLDELLVKSKQALTNLEKDSQYFSDLFRAKAVTSRAKWGPLDCATRAKRLQHFRIRRSKPRCQGFLCSRGR